MSGEQAESLPEELQTWLDERATEADVETDELLTRAVVAYRLVEEEDGLLDESGVNSGVTDELDRLDERVDGLQSELDEKIDDVRTRVVQVKREADAKAPADHGHPDLEERVNTAGTAATEAHEQLDQLGERLDRGFENYEEILTYLRDTTDDLDDKLTRLARAVVSLRSRTARMEATVAQWRGVDDLKTEANRHGVTSAKCGGCDSVVHVGLLAKARCPHCEQPFTDVEPARGFFGSATLAVGDRPALAGQTADETVPTPTELLNEEVDGEDADPAPSPGDIGEETRHE
ncbi:hypothetical protein SAMN04487949_2093 [Halogranum gelatinilyticum]|uniref:CopG family transcriptional regulator n=1 Tax=Halogranum gelatinilyticum TaxID=660521 RepID=A0A1G9U9V5_9EURY|nr:hypothetical protein [Halogranum gelatinilyticum]SDM56325.1 hypothetical protein SAMN04487949_2093 [Halogranum gelatinilyticum]